MRVVVLSTFPWLDRHAYKHHFLQQLARKPYVKAADVVLVYGKTRLADYSREASKLGWRESLSRLFPSKKEGQLPVARQNPGPGARATTSQSLRATATALNMRVHLFPSLGDQPCIKFLKAFDPDAVINLGGQYVPRAVLQLARNGVFSAHYAELPAIRGSDTVRWSLLLDRPLAVTHISLAPALDMGDILRLERVAIRNGDSFGDVYRRCQDVATAGHLELLDALHQGAVGRLPQRRSQGQLFYRMGRHLREKVDNLLRHNSYSHYVQAD